LDQYRVTVDEKIIPVTMIEFQILSVLISNPDQVFSRGDLLTAAHGKYSEHYDRTVDSHIKNLRKKLNLNEKYCFIKTVYGVGYRLGFGVSID
jgi:DNA-binding response OmpR family regulator